MARINLSPLAGEETSYSSSDDVLLKRKIMKSLKVVDGQLQSALLQLQPNAITATVMGTTAFSDFANSKENKINYSATEPSPKGVGTLWMDTTETPMLLKRWDGTYWRATAFNQSQIDVRANTISTSVVNAYAYSKNNIDTMLADYSTITQTASSIELAIGQVYVGGKNLLKASDVIKNSATYNIATYALTEPLNEGEEVTISLKGSLGADREAFAFYNSGGMILLNGANIVASDFNADGIATKTFPWRIAGAANTTLYVYQLTNGDTTSSTITWIKLERGNKRTDWTPAEDELKGAKYTFDGTTATFTGGGLIIKNNAGTTVFSADVNGNLDITGKITSDSGAIGGWTIGANYLQSADGKTGISATGKLSSNGIYYALWLASTDGQPQNAVSGFRNSGHFFTSSAAIGGWNVNSSSIYKGGIKLDATNERIYCNTSAYFYAAASGRIGVSGVLQLQATLPQTDNTYDLGISGSRWATIWCNDASLNGSDRRLKKEIGEIEKGVDLILKLRPVQYKWKAKERGRFHYGFVAQELKDTLDELHIDAGVYADPTVKPDWDTGNPEENNKEHYLALRYSELIAPLVQTVQYLNEELQKLRQEIALK